MAVSTDGGGDPASEFDEIDDRRREVAEGGNQAEVRTVDLAGCEIESKVASSTLLASDCASLRS
jgi:hypothetical protein